MPVIARKLPFEIDGTEVGSITVTIKINEAMLPALNMLGYSGEELSNTMKVRLIDAINAMDGSVPGLVVSDPEHL